MSEEERRGAGDPDAPWTSVARALAGEGTEAERAAFQREMVDHPERAALVDALDTALRPLSAPAAGVDVEAALARVMARRAAAPSPVETPAGRAAQTTAETKVIPFPRPMAAPPSTRVPLWRRGAVLAAAAVFLLLAGISADVLLRARHPESVSAYATATGGRAAIRLPDGTRVQLGPASRVAFVTRRGDPARLVRLSGQAYFEVVHDAARPFEVRTSAATVRDVGTAFSVRADSGGDARVAVTRGSVAVEPAGGGVARLLHAGDLATVEDGRVAVRRGAATDDDVAWTHGRLVFRDEPLASVAADLRRWYGVTVVVDPALAGRHVTATFDAGQNADEVLRVIAATVGGEIARHGDTADVSASARARR